MFQWIRSDRRTFTATIQTCWSQYLPTPGRGNKQNKLNTEIQKHNETDRLQALCLHVLMWHRIDQSGRSAFVFSYPRLVVTFLVITMARHIGLTYSITARWSRHCTPYSPRLWEVLKQRGDILQGWTSQHRQQLKTFPFRKSFPDILLWQFCSHRARFRGLCNSFTIWATLKIATDIDIDIDISKMYSLIFWQEIFSFWGDFANTHARWSPFPSANLNQYKVAVLCGN